jgi:hypothetical protein
MKSILSAYPASCNHKNERFRAINPATYYVAGLISPGGFATGPAVPQIAACKIGVAATATLETIMRRFTISGVGIGYIENLNIVSLLIIF